MAVNGSGRSSFNLLQHHRSKANALRFYAFDLLYDRGRSLLKVPLLRRRELLKKVVSSLKDPILLSEAFDAEPSELVRAAKELALEGVVAKRRDSLYESGKRSGAWVKYRINQGQEFVIGGYVPDHPFDSIIVGYYQDGKLYYAAKVRNGFVPRTRSEVFQRLKGLEHGQCSRREGDAMGPRAVVGQGSSHRKPDDQCTRRNTDRKGGFQKLSR